VDSEKVVSPKVLIGLAASVGHMSNLKTELEHIKHHIKYPANKTQVIAACNNMSDVPSIDKDFVAKSLPESNYKGPEDVVKALLNKV
jgi:hypothetical protein